MEQNKYTVLSVAKEAAMLAHRPAPGEDDVQVNLRNGWREATEKSYSDRLAMHIKLGELQAVHSSTGDRYDPNRTDINPSDPAWSLDAAEREKALELLGHLVRHKVDVAGRHTVVLQSLEGHAKEAAAKNARQAKDLYFLDEAAQDLADQLKKSESWARDIWERMESAGKLPDGHKLRLTVRDVRTGLIELRGTRGSRSVVVSHADVNAWLEAQDAGYKWGGNRQQAVPPPQPVQRRAAQEDAILAKLVELSFDPQAVPRGSAGGLSAAKNAVRVALGYTTDVMNKAWQRLRTDGRIKDA